MARNLPAFCAYCGRSRLELGYLSARGRCRDCADAAMVDAVHQMRAREGPVYEWWIERLAGAMVGKALEHGIIDPADER